MHHDRAEKPRKTWGLKIGNGFIRDLLNPRADEIDIKAVTARLMQTHRWTNNPKALTVYHHSNLVEGLADVLRTHDERLHADVRWWCRYHDYHEGITGDIPGPLKHLIAQETAILTHIEMGLDSAICAKLGWTPPSRKIKEIVHDYDKQAETIEWLYVLGGEPEPWNYPLDHRLTPELCRKLLTQTGGWSA